MKISILTILFLFIGLFAISQKENKQVVKGNELYKQKEYEKAIEAYSKATTINNNNPQAQYNLGNSLFRLQNFDAAQSAFDVAAQNAKTNNLKSQANYNSGVSNVQSKKLPEAIQYFKNALKLNPTDNEARENLQKAINELKKEQEQKPKDKNEDKKDDPKNNDKPPPKPDDKNKLNKNQAEQMLNALRQEEKQLQKNLQQKKQPAGSQVQDW